MGYVPERMTDYPQESDDYPLHIDAEKLMEAVEKYYEDPIGVKVALAIATFADSKGLAFPGVSRLSDMTGCTWTEVSKAVGRLQALGILTVKRRRFKNSKHCHNEYRFAKQFVRKTADIRSSHFLGNVLKWKAKAEDVAKAVVDHAQRAVGVVKDTAEKLVKPAEPVPAPVEEKSAEPANGFGVRIAAMVDAHPELAEEFLAHPEKAAAMAGANNPTCDAQYDVSKPVEETPATVKRETSLDTLPANTQGNTADTSPMQNAPRFLNGETDARWHSQQLLHQLNPTMYPAW